MPASCLKFYMSKITVLRFFKLAFLADFQCNDFAYVLYPFLRIFKIFGYYPIRLRSGAALHDKCDKVEWDLTACLLTLTGGMAYIVGFAMGMHHLSLSEEFRKMRDTNTIAFYMGWTQIVTLFVLGAVAVLTSWTYMPQQRKLCALIFSIDQHVRTVVDTKVDYKLIRKRLLVEFLLTFLVPTLSSMVNCLVIQPAPKSFSLATTCYWFICFAPIMLLTCKEFQFFSLLMVLKSKFEIINRKLEQFTEVRQRIRVLSMCRIMSTSEIPLTASIANPSNTEQVEEPDIKTLHKLLDIYSLTADGVDLVLKIFAWHLVFLTSVSIGVITIQSYNLFTLVAHSVQMEPHQIFFIISWIVVQILAIGINVSACSMTSNTMSRTGTLLHKIRLNSSAESMVPFYQILQLFSLEVLQRKNNFTAAGFFDINYKLITSIIAAVTTYLVILIQFHLTNIPEAHFHSPPA